MPSDGIRYIVVESGVYAELDRITIMQMPYLDSRYYHHLLRTRVLKKYKWLLFLAVSITDLVSHPPISVDISPCFFLMRAVE